MMNYNQQYPIQMNNYLQPDFIIMNVPQQQLNNQLNTQINNQINQQEITNQELIKMRKICLEKLPKASSEILGSIVKFIDSDELDIDLDLSELSYYQLSYILHLLDPNNYPLPIKIEQSDNTVTNLTTNLNNNLNTNLNIINPNVNNVNHIQNIQTISQENNLHPITTVNTIGLTNINNNLNTNTTQINQINNQYQFTNIQENIQQQLPLQQQYQQQNYQYTISPYGNYM